MIYAALSIFEGEKFPMSKTSSEYKNALKVILKLVEGKLNYIHLSIYRVFGNEGQTESGSNLIIFLPEILPKAF